MHDALILRYFERKSLSDHLVSVHAGDAGVIITDHTPGGVDLELLQRHDLLLQSVPRDQPAASEPLEYCNQAEQLVVTCTH